MQINLLKSIVEDIAGKQAREIVDLLFEKRDINEFLIAKKLKLTINQTRNILYKLSDSGLVSFVRKKDKRKGWYIYFWTLNTEKSLELLENRLLTEISQLEAQLKNRKTKRFYFCETCSVEVGEETALLHNFTCSECGQVYKLAVQDKAIEELKNKIEKIKKNVSVIEAEKREIEEKQIKRGKRKIKRKAGKIKKKEKMEKKAGVKKKIKVKRKKVKKTKQKKSKKSIKKKKK